MNEILRIENLCKYYGSGDSLVKAVDGISFTVSRGEFVSIVGKSGSGKSTLLHLMGGLDYPSAGKVYINEMDIYELRADELAVIRRRNTGFVFQAFNLVNSLNVWENVVLPIGLDGRKADEMFVVDVLETLGIENKIHNLPETLSGGQQQRVAIARALVARPDIVLADEPTGNLDSKAGTEVVGLLRDAAKKYGQTVVMITHDKDIAKLADRIITIEDGKVVSYK